MNVSCHVIQDLFVPYIEDTCTDESRILVEGHLKHCENCQKTLKTYQAPIPDMDMKADAEAKKPFQRIRRKICFFIILSIVLLIGILPIAIYQAYGHTHSFYEADRVFCGLDNSDFINAAKANGMENQAETMYKHMYYTLQNRNGTAAPDASLSELVDEYNVLDQIALDYENAEFSYDSDFDTITVTIPFVLPDDAVPTVLQLLGTRVGVGKYCITHWMLYPKNIVEENYVALDSAGVVFDTLDAWPFTGYATWTVKAWEKYDVLRENPKEPKDYSDTGLKIPSGVYVYTNDDGQETLLTVYDNGTLMCESEKEIADTDGFPHIQPSVLGYLYHTATPCPYFIIESELGRELIVRYEKTGIRNTHTIEFMEDGNLVWRDRLFVRVGDIV